MIRAVLNTLGAIDYGIYNVVGGVVAMFGFLTSTLANGTQRFLTFQLGKNNFDELKKTFAIALNIHIVLAAVILILAETGGLWFLNQKLNIPVDRRGAAFWVYQISILASLISIIQVPYNASIIAHERMNIYAYISIVEVLLKLAAVFLLTLSLWDKLISYSLLVLVTHVIVLNIYRIYCKWQYRECRFKIISDWALYKPMLVFSQWLMLHFSGYYVANYGINFLLNIFGGPVINAARAISVQVSTAASSFVGNFQKAVNPSIIKYYAVDKKDELFALIFQNVKFSFCLMWLIALPFLLKISVVLQYWLKNVPAYTGLFCQLMILDTLIGCIIHPVNTIIQASGKLKWVCVFGVVGYVLVLPVSWFLLKAKMPIYVPVIIYILDHILILFSQVYFLYKDIAFSIKRFGKEVVSPLSLIIFCSLPAPLAANFFLRNGMISLILVSLIAVLSILIAIYFIALDKEMKRIIIRRVSLGRIMKIK
jgi:O-antigen/teichoic acid export membrane protein